MRVNDSKKAWERLTDVAAFIGFFMAVTQVVDFLQTGKLSTILLSILGVSVVVTGVAYSLRRGSRKDQLRTQTMSSGWHGRSRLASVTAVVSLIISVLALSGTVVITGLFQETEGDPGPGPIPSPSPKPSTSDGAPTTSCPPAGQPDAKPGTVISLVEPSYPLTVGPSYYKVKLAGKIHLEVGGQLHGSVPQGKKLFLLGWPDPTTRNSLPEHNPGSGYYYRASTLLVWGDCWLRPQGAIAYEGAHGITYRQLLVLVDDAQVDNFTAEKYALGYKDQDLDSFGVVRLGYFDVPTNDL